MSTALESAEHWEKLANEAEAAARWDIERGIDLSSFENSTGAHKARTYRQTAAALRKEHETGVPHCNCHLVPIGRCESQPQNRRLQPKY